MALHLIMRPPSNALRRALSGHPQRSRIDPSRAVAQHEVYRQTLQAAGGGVVLLPPEPDLPDACFTWDTVLAFPAPSSIDRTALLCACRPAEPSRRPEVASVFACARHLAGPNVPILQIDAPGTLDGGDVITFDGRVAIGLSARTNAAGAEQLAQALERIGYEVFRCPVQRYLHLASAVCPVGGRQLIGTPLGFSFLDAGGVTGASINRIEIAEQDVVGANVLAVQGRCFLAAGVPAAAAALRQRGLAVTEVDLDDFTLADGGPTCLVAPVFTPANQEQ
jgi:dimethylargininase